MAIGSKFRKNKHMTALEKKAIKAAWEHVLDAHVKADKIQEPVLRKEINESVSKARSWLEVFLTKEE